MIITPRAVISEAFVSGEEIFQLVTKVEPHFDGLSIAVVVTACLAMAIQAMNPDLEAEEIQAAVKSTSEHICLWLDSLGEPSVPKEKLN